MTFMRQEPISVADRGRHPPGGVMSEAVIVDAVRTPTEPAVKWIYDFAQGSRDMRELLGGKGSGIAEMTRVLGPDLVPAGFTITTEACVEYMRADRSPPEGRAQRCARLDAGDDGHGPEPGPGRRRRGGAGGAYRQRALCVGFLPTARADV